MTDPNQTQTKTNTQLYNPIISIEELNSIIINHNLTNDEYSKLKTIFNSLDVNQKGTIKRSSFYGFVAKNEDLSRTSIKNEINTFFQSEGEKIMKKLMKFRRIFSKYNESEALEDLDYIVSSLSNKDIHDYEFSSDVPEFLNQYSNMVIKKQREDDMSKVKSDFNKSSTKVYKSIESSVSNHNDFNANTKENEVEHRRKSYLSEASNLNLTDPSAYLKVNQLLNKIEDFDFNVFDLESLANKKTLLYISKEVFDLQFFFDDLIDEVKFISFLNEITKGYSRSTSPYHNDIHAADVLQTTYVLTEKGSLYYKCLLTELDYISLMLSAICHDYKHPGIGNSYIINSVNSMALTYNDMSPLENFHVSEAFKVILKPEYYIFKKLNPSEFRLMRRRMIECILSTDMTSHTKNLSALKNKINIYNVKEGNNVTSMIQDKDNSVLFNNQQVVLNYVIHAADISNPAKIEFVYKKWVDLVFEEFFYQGDLEKKEGLQVSMLCDRSSTSIVKAQIGFIKFVVKPTFEMLTHISPEVKTYLYYINKNLIVFEGEDQGVCKERK